jgi:hypothetical protein
MKSDSLPSNPEPSLSRRDISLLALGVILVLAVYLVASAALYRIGFPLDDAWIHQTYARNLALRGEWTFVPGQPSGGGSTAPAWTILLAPGFWLGLAPYVWAFLLGGLLLLGLGIAVELILRRVLVSYRPAFPWAGLLFIFEWHMAWAAFSGMETILHILLVVIACGMLLTGSRRYLVMGIVCGASVWVRPDGLTLLGPLGLAVVFGESGFSSRLKGFFRLGIGFLSLFAPYLLFNLLVAGMPMPNTFYAKQAEYAAWQASPPAEKLLALSLQFFVGVAIVLLPGFLQAVSGAVRKRDWRLILVVVWVIGYIGLYVSRLPLYQHGRYIMPAMAVYLLVAAMGWLENSLRPRRQAIRFVAVMMLVVLALAFAFGSYSYGMDVALIESQMVDTALWAAENIPAGDLVAAHDIGALGYFSQVSILDLAGLISPEVIPIMTADAQLAAYMDAGGVEFFIAFSGWRPALAARGEALYSTGSRFVPRSELGSMTVYRWLKP